MRTRAMNINHDWSKISVPDIGGGPAILTLEQYANGKAVRRVNLALTGSGVQDLRNRLNEICVNWDEHLRWAKRED